MREFNPCTGSHQHGLSPLRAASSGGMVRNYCDFTTGSPFRATGQLRSGARWLPMHDQEKSDSGIVAGKPMNKAGRSAPESVEPRPETEGNADQRSTLRTQSRERATQALGRVHKPQGKGRRRSSIPGDLLGKDRNDGECRKRPEALSPLILTC